MRLPLLLVVLTLAVAGCQCGGARPTCSVTSDCRAGQVCSQGFCSASSSGGGAGGSADSGLGGGTGGGTGGSSSSDGGCPVACGASCCPLSQSCDQGTCKPLCDADVRCGSGLAEVCCSTAQVCYLDVCTVPGPACGSGLTCPSGSYCDTSLSKCLPLGPNATCEFHSTGNFNPTSLWKYVVGTDAYTQVMMTPVVIDVNGDKIPDVLANFFTVSGGYGGAGVMRALSGDDGHVLWTTADTADLHVHPPASIAVADLDGTGVMVAVTEAQDGTLLALDARTGTKLWKSHDGSSAAVACAAEWGGPAIANLIGDAKAEIVCGLAAFDSTGLLLWTHGTGGGAVGPLTAIVDLNHDGMPDITDGHEAWRGDGTALGWTGAGYSGFPAIGDFVNGSALGQDGKPEIVVVGASAVALVNGQTGAILAPPQTLPSYDGTTCIVGGGTPGTGGPPTVADFDGDGQPEVGVAALGCYTMFKLTSTGSGFAWSIVWSKKVQDQSSSVTGSSVFDFDGDGKAEVVYADEVKIHVFNGADGTEIFTRPHCSGTTYEYPLVVDVNGNGRADLVVPENTYAAGGLGCDPSVTPGIQVLHDGNDSWVNTRQIWNQHTYHVTNVCDGLDLVCGGPGAAGNVYGRVPVSEPDNWTFVNARGDAGVKPLNDYRQNVQGEGLFNAPDLASKDLGVDCSGGLTLRVRVVNQGALGVLPGVKVAFYLSGPPRTLLGIGHTLGRLLPGQSEVVSLTLAVDGGAPTGTVLAVVDDDGTSAGAISECHEDNNVAGPITISCIN